MDENGFYLVVAHCWDWCVQWHQETKLRKKKKRNKDFLAVSLLRLQPRSRNEYASSFMSGIGIYGSGIGMHISGIGMLATWLTRALVPLLSLSSAFVELRPVTCDCRHRDKYDDHKIILVEIVRSLKISLHEYEPYCSAWNVLSWRQCLINLKKIKKNN
jgi:hypothetical protein